MLQIFASLINSNVLALADEIKAYEPHIDGFHLDITDLECTPTIAFGPILVNAIKSACKKQIWVHMMVKKPEQIFRQLECSTHDILTLQIENLSDLEVIQFVNDDKKKSFHLGISINPDNSLSRILPLIKKIENRLDHILIMSIFPGFFGQVFMHKSIDQLKQLITYQQQNMFSKHIRIGIDGGINQTTLPLVKNYIKFAAIGSGIFQSNDPIKTIQLLRGQGE